MPAYMMGVRACISGIGICLPELVVALSQACLAGKWEEARELQKTVLRTNEIIHFGPTMETVHAILEMRGLESGLPRRPFHRLDSGIAMRVREALVGLGLLN